MSELPALFPDLFMGRIGLEKGAVRLPKIAKALLLLVPLRNLVPKPDTGPCRPVSNHECNNLPGAAAQRHPEPSLTRAIAYLTGGGRRSNTRQVQEHRRPRADRPARLASQLDVPFQLSLREPARERISTHSKNATDRAFGSTLSVGLQDALLLFLGIFVRVRVEHQVGPTAFAMVLLRPAGAVAVFDDVGASAFAAGVSRLNHDLVGRVDLGEPKRTYSMNLITTG